MTVQAILNFMDTLFICGLSSLVIFLLGTSCQLYLIINSPISSTLLLSITIGVFILLVLRVFKSRHLLFKLFHRMKDMTYYQDHTTEEQVSLRILKLVSSKPGLLLILIDIFGTINLHCNHFYYSKSLY